MTCSEPIQCSLAGTHLLIVNAGDDWRTSFEQIALQWQAVPHFEHDPEACFDAARDGSFDAVILDLRAPANLPWLRRFRRVSTVPVIAIEASRDRFAALEAGADDCLTIPFDSRELLARVQGILRRTDPSNTEVLRAGAIRLIPSSREVFAGRERLDLTAMECDILEYLLRNRGQTVSRDQLSLHLHNRPASPFDRSIDTHVSRIRRKLGSARSMILSVRGTGYQLRVPSSHYFTNLE